MSEHFNTLFSKVISKTAGASKILRLIQPKGKTDFVLADLRGFYNNGNSAGPGVCLTPFEFDWFARSLLLGRQNEQSLTNKNAARSLTIKPKPFIKGVEVIQFVNEKHRKLNLREAEVQFIIDNYGSFYHIIEELEENSDQNRENGADIIQRDT